MGSQGIEGTLPFQEAHCLDDHSNAILALTINAQGEYFLSGSQDKSIKLWNSQRGNLIQSYSGHGREVASISVTRNNSQFASCGGEKLVFLWEVATGQIVRKFEGHQEHVNSVDFSQDGNVLASGSYDATVRLWDCRSRSHEPIQKLVDAKDSVSSVKVSDYGILTGSIDGFVRDYDIRMGVVREDEIGPPVTSVNFSGDGNCILVGTLDNTIRLLDRDTGRMLSSYGGHENAKYKLDSRLTNTDAYVVGGSEDGTIHFWELVQGKTVKVLKAHQKAVTSIVYHPKEPLMISGSIDGKIKIWQSSVL